MSLKEKVLSGLFWTTGARLLSQLISWTITIIVIRLLTPADYGLLAMGMVFASVLMVLADAGLGAALVQAPRLDDAMVRRIFGAAILIHSGLFLVQFLAAPAIAGYFGEERLVPILRVISLELLLGIFGVLPYAFLVRSMHFKSQSVIGVASSICSGLITLALAWHGWGVWALVLGNLAGRVLDVVAINIVAPVWRWPSFALWEARGLIFFGSQILASRLLWLVYSQADIVVAGKLLGKELVGFYSVAMHLASLPVQKLAAIFNTVAYPAFSRMQDDRERVIASLLKAVRLMSLTAFPMMWGLSSVAPEAVRLLLGEAWVQTTIPLQLLALIMPLRLLSILLPSATDGIGRPDVALYNLIIATAVMPVAFYVGCQWGLLGLAVSWALVYPLVVMQNLHRTARVMGMRVLDFATAASRPLAASIVMYAAVAAARQALPAGVPEAVRLGLLVACGVLTYACISWFVNRQGLLELRDLVRPASRTVP